MMGEGYRLEASHIIIVYQTLMLFTVIFPNFNLDDVHIPTFQIVFQNFKEVQNEDGSCVTKENIKHTFYEILAFHINNNMLLSNFEFQDEEDSWFDEQYAEL